VVAGLVGCIAAGCFAASAAATSPSTVGYYRFENGTAGAAATGSGAIVDSSGNNQAGTPSGGPTYSSDVPLATIPATGAANDLSLSFNGQNQSISFPGEWPFNTGDATLQFWMKYTATGLEQDIFWTRTDNTDADRFNIGITGDGNPDGPDTFFSDFRDPSGNLDELVNNVPLTPGVWHFLAFVKSGEQFSLYLDGKLAETVTSTDTLPNNTGWTISGRGSNAYDGELDEVQLSSAALAPAQLESVVAAAPSGTRITKSTLPRRRKPTATFRFTASGTVSGFQCALVSSRVRLKPRFATCTSPKTYQHLSSRSGRYTFEVRAINSVGPDPKPAKKVFTA